MNQEASGPGIGLHTRLRSVLGDRSATKLAKAFDMFTVDDLLRHYPRRYVAMDRPTDLRDIRVGQHVTVLAEVVDAKNYRFARKGSRRPGMRTKVLITDRRAQLSLTFFDQGWQQKRLAPGTLGMFAGEVREFNGELQLTHPDMDLLASDTPSSASRLARGILPIYPATKKVSSWAIEDCIRMCLDGLADLDDPLDATIRAHRDVPEIHQAFIDIHQPESTAHWQRAQYRFTYEEAFAMQMVLARRRQKYADGIAVSRAVTHDGIAHAFNERLPFSLTDGQRDVSATISHDLSKAHPMHRLLQGDVGSGKTIVALFAMLQVVDAGGQAALLAPTEVLAAQHFRSISTLLGDLGRGGMLDAAEQATGVELLTGSMPAAQRKAALLRIASGEAGIVIGTHALLQDTVQFAELGLLVVDEQHRFGVEQRAVLADRQEISPHVLVMTATPIPRTVAMTVFGDLEVSTLRELPAGRQRVQTTVVPVDQQPQWLERAWTRIAEEAAAGSQCYIVASRIGDEPATAGDDPQRGLTPAQNIPAQNTVALQDLYRQLAQGPLTDLRIAMLHGRMPAEEKDDVMNDFAAGRLDVLVATTVIEVGVDVANATVMAIMDADRFGISQLHQLRGRIGRGAKPGLCLLMTQSAPQTPARERLDAVASTSDGFELAQRDVDLRREGDVLGSAQSGGRSSLRLLSVARDGDVIEQARHDAQEVLTGDPRLSEHQTLLDMVDVLDTSEHGDFLERA